MKDPVDLHIGQRLRHRRWLHGLTQLQVAQAIGCRFQQIQKYESGANRVSAAKLWDLAQALSVPVTYFYVGLEDADGRSGGHNISDGALEQRETMELVRAYYAMPQGPRRRLLELAKAVSHTDTNNGIVREVLPFSDAQSAA